MTRSGRALPEQLAQELKLVLRGGNRPAKVKALISRLPGLASCVPAPPLEDRWATPIAICKAIEKAVACLGDGPYGRAAQVLFGTSGGTGGLPVGRRRAAAAAVLDIEPATFIRHWESSLRLDLGVILYLEGLQ